MQQYLEAILSSFLMAALVTVAMYFAFIRPKERDIERARLDLERDREHAKEAALLDAKAEILHVQEAAELELKQKQATLNRLEEKLFSRDEAIEERRKHLEAREEALSSDRRLIAEKNDKLEHELKRVESRLQELSGLSGEQAKAEFLKQIESDFRELGQLRADQIMKEAVAEASAKARRIVLDAMQRTAVDYVSEATIAVVELPSEDMKGRIIGREGRNIRAFEQATGVDLIIDETPEAVVISCFDPIRRETARVALMNLMVDGRIHPGRIEELYEKAQEEVSRMVLEAGERAAERANVGGVPPRIAETLGKLRFRTSYAQNVLDHSVEVARLAGMMAGELGFNVEVAKRAGLFHDIGKALGPDSEGPHALTGMEYLKSLGEKDAILVPVGAHHYDIEPTTPEAMLVIIADSLSASRPGARRESLENYMKRLTGLEQLANGFDGVERSFALHAGREVRLIVKPDKIDDLGAARLAVEVARKIEAEMDFPGQIKVTVIRETRAQEFAK